jgi:2-oxoglutarate dehydrogenase E2 component (dihydrolipoamide succinyltransferase)
MRIEVRVPVLPESVAEGTLLNWHKKPGDAVARDENLVDIETDKVVLDVPAPQDGVLVEVLKNEGEVVAGEDVIAVLDRPHPQGGRAQAHGGAEVGPGRGPSARTRGCAGPRHRPGRHARGAAG